MSAADSHLYHDNAALRQVLEQARDFIDPDRDPPRINNRKLVMKINAVLSRVDAQGSPRCDRCGSSGYTYILCSGCGMPASPPFPVQSALKECASRCRYDGDLFHDQGNIARRDASWKSADMAEAALSALTSTSCGGK